MYRKRVPSTVFLDAFGRYYTNDSDFTYTQEQLQQAYEERERARNKQEVQV